MYVKKGGVAYDVINEVEYFGTPSEFVLHIPKIICAKSVAFVRKCTILLKK